MSLRPNEERDYIRETARARNQSGGPQSDVDTTKVVTIGGGHGTALPPAGTMSREITEVFGYLGRRFWGFFVFPYRIGRRIGGRLR
jgi:hypothetical protein